MTGAIAKIAEMIAEMIVGKAGGKAIGGIIDVTGGIAEMIATVHMGTTTGTNRRGITTDWIEDRKMRGIAGHSTRIIPATLEKVIPRIAKGFVEGMYRDIARVILLAGGNW